MAFLQSLAAMGIAHLLIALLFGFMIICLLIRAILSFFPMLSPANPFVRFFINIVGPVYDPLYRVLPRVSLSFLDLSGTIAFIFAWWALAVMESLIFSALPPTW